MCERERNFAFILARFALPMPLAVFLDYTEQCSHNGSSQSGIAPELNWSQLYTICRYGQSGKVIDLLEKDAAYRLVCSEQQVEFAHLYKYHHQSGERQASLKAA